MLLDCTITCHISCFWTAPSHATYHASGLHHHMPHIMLLDCTITRHYMPHVMQMTAPSHTTYHASGLHHHTRYIMLLDCTITRHISCFWIVTSHTTHHASELHHHSYTTYTFKACLHCGKMNPDPIRIQTGSVVSRSDVVRLRPHCNTVGSQISPGSKTLAQ